jgi:RNA polymerase sigma factor (sigma-70 family)
MGKVQFVGSPVRGPFVGTDVDELYRAFSKSLERIVRHGVQAPEPVIEDACQFAWARLIHHQARVRRETVLAWLVKTAVREALKLTGHGRREQSLDAELEERGEVPAPDLRPGPSELYDQRERLRTLATLSTRQQRILWLYGLGLNYDEIASRDGCSPRTIERQLKRARESLREVELRRPGSEAPHGAGARQGAEAPQARKPSTASGDWKALAADVHIGH